MPENEKEEIPGVLIYKAAATINEILIHFRMQAEST
jgi:hypothetical protein